MADTSIPPATAAVTPDVAGPPEVPIDPGPSRPAGRRRRRLSGVGRWLRSDRRAQVAVGFIVLVLVAGVLATFFAQDPLKLDVLHINAGPSADHWLGTDDLGRDVFSRLLAGGLVSLRAACIAVGVAILIGVPLGLLAGFRGGIADEIVMRGADTVLAFPGLVLAVGVVAMLGPGLTNAMIAVGIVFAPSLARLMRAQVLGVKEHLYVEAAVTFGGSSWQIIKRHIVPNSIQPVVVQTSLLFAAALLAEAGLSFIGLGVQPPDPSWGSMLGRAYKFMRTAPLQMIAPGLIVMLTALAFNAIGDSLRDELDPTRRRQRRLRPAPPVETAVPT
jgi:peptide/nickel transport system permease protein